jgi:aldose 1-epimerase
MQLYSGNMLTPATGKLGARYTRRSGLCLEPQGYPDAVNNPSFDSIVLKPGEVFRATILFRLLTG